MDPRWPRKREASVVARSRSLRASGVPTDLSPEEVKANDQAIQTVVEVLGGRTALCDTLAVAHDAPEVEQVVSMLLDPRYDQWSIKRICAAAHLTVVDVFAAYKKAMIVQAQLAATRVITQKLVAVVEDVMTRAAPYEIPCHECRGTGEVRDPDKPQAPASTCPQCAGHGKLLQLPDLDRQKLALELGQLVQKPGGINIQQNNLTPAADPPRSPGGSLVDLQHAVRELLQGPRQPLGDPIEADFVADVVGSDPVPDPPQEDHDQPGTA